MIEDIQATFMHRFTSLARIRVTHALDATGRRDPTALATVVRDMHSLAGEAGLLGLAEVVPLARSGEDRARKLAGAPSAEAAEEMLVVLRELEAVVERLAAR
jgi:HPt (histidine-containing phosphotransfer) domain-containing protein